MESGFNKKTKIQLQNGTVKKISDIRMLDTLKNNEIVLGIVEIQGNDIEQYSYFLNNNNNIEVSGAPNLQIYNANLGILHTLNNQIIKKNTKSSKKLYHLITDKGKFEINGYIFYDYNGALDGFLSSQLSNLLSLEILSNTFKRSSWLFVGSLIKFEKSLLDEIKFNIDED